MLPKDFTERMKELLGGDFPAFLASYEKMPERALRVNPLKGDVETFLTRVCSGGTERFLPKDSYSGEAGDEGASSLKARLGDVIDGVGRCPWPYSLERVPWERNGFYFSLPDEDEGKDAGKDKGGYTPSVVFTSPGRHPYHDAGVYYIQEPSAMAPAAYLMSDVWDGMRVLDLCAAPGGKCTQIAGYMRGRGILVANEVHPARAKILSENIERMGVRNAIATNETPHHLAEIFPEYFTHVLVDAPCSGEGMFRKNPYACNEWSVEEVHACAARQDGILDCAAEMTAPGGRLVYSTCTFAPEEDEGSIARFLERHPEFSVVPVREFAGMEGGVGTIRIFPHKLRGEGHFIAVMQKAGGTAMPECAQATDGQRSEQNVPTDGGDGQALPIGQSACVLPRSRECANGLERGIPCCYYNTPGKGVAEYVAFCAETLRDSAPGSPNSDAASDGIFLRFGDNLYLAPHGTPSLQGIKVLRPGLHLGIIKKGRFEPSHALALALRPEDALRVADLHGCDERVTKYLHGESFPYDGEKGWHLVCVDGYGLGWGKCDGTVMKNHYPKGLRKC